MRRSGVLAGIGNPDPELMDGQSTGNDEFDKVINECSEDCYKTFFKGTKMDYGGVDAGYSERNNDIKIGIEPAYFGDDLKMIILAPEKKWCRIVTGHAFGYYGSGIRSTTRRYNDYKYSTKFTRFVDKWHDKLFATKRKEVI